MLGVLRVVGDVLTPGEVRVEFDGPVTVMRGEVDGCVRMTWGVLRVEVVDGAVRVVGVVRSTVGGVLRVEGAVRLTVVGAVRDEGAVVTLGAVRVDVEGVRLTSGAVRVEGAVRTLVSPPRVGVLVEGAVRTLVSPPRVGVPAAGAVPRGRVTLLTLLSTSVRALRTVAARSVLWRMSTSRSVFSIRLTVRTLAARPESPMPVRTERRSLAFTTSKLLRPAFASRVRTRSVALRLPP
jgi:hypothetical protein